MSAEKLFTAEERGKIAKTLARWAKNHPDPDKSTVGIPGGMELSPNLMAQGAADPESDAAQVIYRWFAVITKSDGGISLDQLLDSFEMLANLDDDADDIKAQSRRPPEPRP